MTAAFTFPPALMPDRAAVEDDDLLATTTACAHARAYFVGADGKGPYAGAAFEKIGHDWWDESSVNTITPSDLLALGTLSTPLKGYAPARLLNPDIEARAAALLQQIPPNASISAEDARDLLGENSAASRLYALVRSVGGMGTTRSSKLLARKRPGLIPIRDSNVEKALGAATAVGWWLPFQAMVTSGDVTPIQLAQRIHSVLDLSPLVTPLRVIDVILWRSVESPLPR